TRIETGARASRLPATSRRLTKQAWTLALQSFFGSEAASIQLTRPGELTPGVLVDPFPRRLYSTFAKHRTMKESYYVVALPGDGIGPEVLSCALKFLKAAGRMFQIDFQLEEIPCGGHYYAEHEVEWPAGSFEKCEKADAILLGAVGHEVDGKTVFTKPGKPYPEPQLAGFAQVILNRQKLNLYANVRPVKLYAGVGHKIHGELKQVWEPGKVDYVVIRENTEDAYTGETSSINDGRVTPILITRRATERVVRYAFKLARRRNKQNKVTCVDKSNI